MKILFLTDNFPPEVNAPASRTFEHCREWVRQGASVTVITCAPNFPQGKVYPGYRNKFIQRENIEGIRVIRVWSYITANEGFLKRILDYISFAVMAFFTALTIRCDLIIATSPQFFTAVAGGAASIFKRKPWIMEVRDLWPESIRAVGALKNNVAYNLLERLELALYRHARSVVVVTESFKENLVARGIQAEKILIIKNGVLLDQFVPMDKDEALVNKLNLSGKFVLAYFGTHGLAHALDFIIRSAASLPPHVQVLLIGDGAEKARLLALKADLKAENITMLEPVSKNEMRRYISVCDAALVNLKKSDTFKTVIPSKIFENAAMTKPILLGVDGESKQIIEHYGAGLAFEPENEPSYIHALSRLMQKDSYAEFQKGCTLLAGDYNRKTLANTFLNHIKSLTINNHQ